MKAVKQKLNDDVQQAVQVFVDKKADEKFVKAELSKAKDIMYGLLDESFERGEFEGNKLSFVSKPNSKAGISIASLRYNVTRVVSKKIVFDYEALKTRIGKKFPNVFQRTYEVADFAGLAAYVKSLGGEPAVFKSFFSVIKSVDNVELDKLSELGYISKDDIEGCYSIDEGNPSYRVTTRLADE